MQAEFQHRGYAIKRSVYRNDELPRIREVLAHNPSVIRGVWEKDACACSRNLLNLASHEAILGPLRELLGEEVVLWGGIYIQREPGEVHPWHTDIESSRVEGGFVSVWIGLEGVTKDSALKLVDHSHDFGKPLQQVIQENSKCRETTTDEDVIRWAEGFHPGHPGIVQPDLQAGDAIFFDGRLWHGSNNLNTEETRTALLFQYARADVPVRIPNFHKLTWPFELRESPRPPCVPVLGMGDDSINCIVEPPPVIGEALKPAQAAAHAIDLDASLPSDQAFRPVPLFEGRTPNLTKLSVHYSVLAPGAQPHPPHAHVDEEILVVLKGKATLRYEVDGKVTDHQASPGDGVFYPSFHRHTIHNPSDESIVYVMLKWVGGGPDPEVGGGPDPEASRGPEGMPQALPLQRFHVPALQRRSEAASGFQAERCFMGPTQHLKALEIHVSTLLPGGGYDAHADDHDVAILVFEGTAQINGTELRPGVLHTIPAGESHDMTNPGDQASRYLVVEFHGGNCPQDYLYLTPKAAPRQRRLFKKRSPKRILRNLGRLVGIKS